MAGFIDGIFKNFNFERKKNNDGQIANRGLNHTMCLQVIKQNTPLKLFFSFQLFTKYHLIR